MNMNNIAESVTKNKTCPNLLQSLADLNTRVLDKIAP